MSVVPRSRQPTNHASLPPLADHWRQLDLREILSRPAAFISISQSNSVDRPGGVQYEEGHAYRGNLEATVRAARDNGLLPIVIGDACGAQLPEQEAATFDRINRFFAPVITADQFVELVQR